MSLRPDERSGRSERSHSRTRERSRSREPPPKSKSKSSSGKSSKSTRFIVEDEEEDKSKSKSKSSTRQARFQDDIDEDKENEDERDSPKKSMPGGFDTEEAKPKQNSREPPKRLPSLSSAGSYLHRDEESETESESDDDEEEQRRNYAEHKRLEKESGQRYREDVRSPHDRKPSKRESDEEDRNYRPQTSRHNSTRDERKYSNGVRSPREAEMPSAPSVDNDRFGPPRKTKTYPSAPYPNRRQESFSTPYPMEMTMPQSPDDYFSPHAMMPAFPDFGAPRSYHTSERNNYIPAPKSPPRKSDRYKPPTDDDDERSPPRRSSTVPYTTQTRETKSSEHRESVSSKNRGQSISESKSENKGLSAEPGPRMNRLSVSNGSAPHASGPDGAPPASPLLEAYRGTYQSASPMPSPMMLPQSRGSDDDIEDKLPPLSPLNSDTESRPKGKIDAKGKRRVVLYDAEGDAEKLAKALNHREARPEPLIAILPELTHDQLLHLRQEYKKQVKIGGRGVNLSKQVKSATVGPFGKAVYVTSLGKWESEAYWANFWYQSHSSNRELLIEALMGRPNSEIREIKNSFTDKRYDDDMSLCMEKELKADKFRVAVLGTLEGRRQEETDNYTMEVKTRDIETLHRAVKLPQGGETAILEIVIKRSDNHLRDVLKLYEKTYQGNFAREALKKSNNLVGEVIAHILNGVINRPARDCLLVRHAINDIVEKTKGVENRNELLMSRLIRLHWDQKHLQRVKDEYKKKYEVDLEEDVKTAAKGDFGKFCKRLLET